MSDATVPGTTAAEREAMRVAALKAIDEGFSVRTNSAVLTLLRERDALERELDEAHMENIILAAKLKFCSKEEMEREVEALNAVNDTALAAAEARATAAERDRDELKRQLTLQRDNNHQRNVELDALHYVWCDGGCKSGVHRYCQGGPLTEEVVAAAERNTKRMRQWLGAHDYRAARLSTPGDAPTGEPK